MIAAWMVRALAAGVLLAVAAWLAESLARLFDRPRRWIWTAALAGAVALPLLALGSPAALAPIAIVTRLIPLAWMADRVLGPAGARAAAGTPPAMVRDGVLLGVWLAASAATAAALLYAALRVRVERARWRREWVDGVRVLVAPDAGPAVVGVRAPEVVLPAWVLDAPAATRVLIVWHEREHQRAGDSRLLAAAALAVAVTPWNPAAWWLLRRLRWAVEADCDARVIAAGADVRSYGEMLLRAAARGASALFPRPALAGRTSQLEWRILAMTSAPRRHRLARALALVTAIAITGAAACDAAAPTSAKPDASTRVARLLGGSPLHVTVLGVSSHGDTIRLAGTDTAGNAVYVLQEGTAHLDLRDRSDTTIFHRMVLKSGTFTVRRR
ncbi:MAG TPA: M56 family metallopeptidase [Gemmatimonadaceae bacterium]